MTSAWYEITTANETLDYCEFVKYRFGEDEEELARKCFDALARSIEIKARLDYALEGYLYQEDVILTLKKQGIGENRMPVCETLKEVRLDVYI